MLNYVYEGDCENEVFVQSSENDAIVQNARHSFSSGAVSRVKLVI